MTIEPDDILEYWFGPEGSEPFARSDLWWGNVDDQEAVDEKIEARFGDLVDRALDGGLEDWTDSSRSSLALVLLLDQFPRHIHRGTSRAFEGGDRAVSLVQRIRTRGWDRELSIPECVFLYMPLMHAEDRDIQSASIEAFRELAERAPEEMVDTVERTLEHAREHAEIIEEFGRYPHRNEALGRTTTPEEREYLEETGNYYGQRASDE